MKDVAIVNHGTLIAFHLQTPAAVEFVDEFVQAESYQFMGNALMVEPRYAADLAQGMADNGLVL